MINVADIVFTAFDETSSWSKSRQVLVDNEVTSTLLDCSDAHTWSDEKNNKDRLGNCETWIRSTPSFAGLIHALSEFDSRVYVGSEPDDLRRRREAPERIIDAFAVRPVTGASSHLFNYSIPLKGLVAIIRNKGQGKSALLDCLARARKSSRTDYFAFLNRQRFLNPKNSRLSSKFEAELTLAGRTKHSAGLAEPHNLAHLEKVEYLPRG